MKQWITVFTLAQSDNRPTYGGAGMTMRLVIPVNVKGQSVRVRISNRSEAKDGTLDEITIAKCSKDGKIEEESLKAVPFAAESGSICIPVGAQLTSDEIPFQTCPGDYIAVSVYCKETPVSAGGIGGYVLMPEKPGNLCRESFSDKNDYSGFEEQYHQPMIWQFPYFRALDIFTEADVRVVSCLGDSVTAQCKWFQPLQEYLYETYRGNVSLTNSGICGNQLLADAKENMPMFGKAALKRIEWDCLADHGVSHMILAMGVNDIGNGMLQKERFESGCLELVEKAHRKGIKVVAFTIYPAALDAGRETGKERARRDFNQIIKSGLFDACIDLEDILKNPEGAGYREDYSEDGIHLTSYGGACMVQGLDKNQLKSVLDLTKRD